MAEFERTLSLQSYNIPTMYIRHRNFGGELTEINSDLDKQDATFRSRDGNNSSLRLEAAYVAGQVNHAGFYLRHRDWVVTLQQEDLTGSIPDPSPEQRQFTLDTTFRMIPGLADASCVSFESVQWSGKYLRHRDWKLYLESADDDLAKRDTTFHLVPGLMPVLQPDIR
jgi:hypothetical protein